MSVPLEPLKIVCYPAEVLREPAKPVSAPWAPVRAFAEQMVVTMKHAEGIGLAAPQVGKSERIIVVDVTQGEQEPLMLANPEILTSSSENKTHEEGCLSIPGVTAEVKRPASITVKAIDLVAEKEVEIEADEILAVCLQHEIDHLNGVLFIDHLSRLRRRSILDKYKKLRAEEKS